MRRRGWGWLSGVWQSGRLHPIWSRAAVLTHGSWVRIPPLPPAPPRLPGLARGWLQDRLRELLGRRLDLQWRHALARPCSRFCGHLRPPSSCASVRRCEGVCQVVHSPQRSMLTCAGVSKSCEMSNVSSGVAEVRISNVLPPRSRSMNVSRTETWSRLGVRLLPSEPNASQRWLL